MTECTRRFPEGIRNFFKFPIFTDLYRYFTEIAEVRYTPVTLNAALSPAWPMSEFDELLLIFIDSTCRPAVAQDNL